MSQQRDGGNKVDTHPFMTLSDSRLSVFPPVGIPACRYSRLSVANENVRFL
jgi:hypothetical protein